MKLDMTGWRAARTGLAGAMALLAACVSWSRTEVVIHESPEGSVYLERMPSRSFQPAHPITLSPELLASVLRGVHVREKRSALQAFLSSPRQGVRVFSEDDVRFLAPLLATGLSQASAEQQVAFRLIQPVSSPLFSRRAGAGVGSSDPAFSDEGPEVTAGTLHADGQSIYFTLTEYRHIRERPDTIRGPNRQLRDPTGLSRREVLFLPEEALRPDTSRRTGLFGGSALKPFIIDYELLAGLPAAQSAPAPSPGDRPETVTAEPAEAPSPPPIGTTTPTVPERVTAEDLQDMKELIIKRDLELEAIKEQVRALRRQLEEQAESQKPKGKKKPATRSTEPDR